VGLRVQAVAALRAARRDQLLVLEVADLRDRDLGELLPERLAHRADRDRLLARPLARGLDRLLGGRSALCGCLRGGHQRPKKASLYLPIWSSSPSVRRWDSILERLT